LMRATRCANLHVEIDSSTYERVGNTQKHQQPPPPHEHTALGFDTRTLNR
jgi:hypothetical protein